MTQLNSSIAVDETILSDDPRIIVMRFGSKSDAMCKYQDVIILRVAPRLQASFVDASRSVVCLSSHCVGMQAKAVFYLVDTISTPELVQQ